MSERSSAHIPVNMPTVVNGPIRLDAYSADWPLRYDRERQRIEAALGDRVVALHHVGSTSVPGLSAKPIIDILLVVEDCGDDAAYVPDLEAAGYVLRIREPDPTAGTLFTGTEPHRVFKGSEIDLNLHVWSRGSGEIARNLTFRDWLRTHPEERDLYQRTKLTLAARNWPNVQDYAEAKTGVINEILARAGWGAD